jgi:hypothetical protein
MIKQDTLSINYDLEPSVINIFWEDEFAVLSNLANALTPKSGTVKTNFIDLY